MLIIPYVFQQFRCFRAKAMSRIVKHHWVAIAFSKILRIYDSDIDHVLLVLITFREMTQIR